jgi:hypothetical protein
MDDREDRALGAGQEARRRIAGDPLDLLADGLEHEVGVPRGAVDRTGDVLHQRPQQAVVGALLGGAQAGAGASDQLGAGERAVQVVVGAGIERRVGHPAPGGDGDRQQPGVAEAGVVAQLAADLGGVEPGRVTVDDDEVDRLLLEGVTCGGGTANRPRRVPRGA